MLRKAHRIGCFLDMSSRRDSKVHAFNRAIKLTGQGDGAGELRGDAQARVADGLAEEREEDGAREGEELGCILNGVGRGRDRLLAV